MYIEQVSIWQELKFMIQTFLITSLKLLQIHMKSNKFSDNSWIISFYINERNTGLTHKICKGVDIVPVLTPCQILTILFSNTFPSIPRIPPRVLWQQKMAKEVQQSIGCTAITLLSPRVVCVETRTLEKHTPFKDKALVYGLLDLDEADLVQRYKVSQ